MKPKVAIVRGKFLNKYEMQSFEPLSQKFDLMAFGSKSPFHAKFNFPVTQLYSLMDLPELPMKMQVLNRVFVDAHYLVGLEEKLKGYDIVHTAETYYRYTQQALDAKKKGFVKKVVVTVLENIPFNNEGIWGRKDFKKRTRDEVDMLVALTQKTKDMLILEGADPKKITIIGSGIDTKRFIPGKRMSQNFINENKKITVLFVGRLEVHKGIYDVLYAFERLLKENSLREYDLELIIVGKGSEEVKLLQLEKALGLEEKVTHQTIAYDQIHKMYQKADIFVVPSCDTKTWQEQYGYMLLEGQAAGLPIVTTYSGSIPEVVGKGAVLVSQHAVEEIVDVLKKLITNPKQRIALSEKARKRAVEFHDIQHKAKQLTVLYESLL